LKRALVAFLAAACLIPGLAFGSSCNHEIVVPIKFAVGKTEWVHRGVGTHYVGYFQKGQSLSIAGAGGTSYDTRGDLSWAASSDEPWQLSIQGPNGFFQMSDDSGVLYVDPLPSTGKYVITIGPCASWGSAGTLVIHASDPRLTIP
jgi:hypothetical protein